MDQRRLLLAALLSMAVLIVWQIAFPPAPPVAPAPAPVGDAESAGPEPGAAEASGPSDGASRAAAEAEASSAAESPAIDSPPIEAEIESEIEIRRGDHVARLTNRGGQLLSLEVPVRKGDGIEIVELVRDRESGPWPLAWVDADARPLDLNDALFAAEISPEGDAVSFRYRGPLGEASKRIVVGEDSRFTLEASASTPDWALLLGPGVGNPVNSEPPIPFLSTGSQTGALNRGAAYSEEGDVESLAARKVDEPRDLPASLLDWVGLEDTYFLTALLPSTPLERVRLVPGRWLMDEEGIVRGFERLSEDDDRDEQKAPRDFLLTVQPAGGELASVGWWGAKHYDDLVEAGAGLEKTIRWGIFRPLSRPLLAALNWIYVNVVHNYGWTIVLMTVLIKLVLFPLTHKSYVSTQKMQQLNPKMEAIRKRYRPKLRDKQGRPDFEMQRKMNEEIQGLFKEEGVNPVGGCLPMLLQLPVFFSFYYLLRGAVELWHAPWIGWIQDLSEPDPRLVLPLVMGATQLVSTRMMPTMGNPAQRIILNTMPIWFTIFALGFPSGLVLYWLTNNLLTIVQQGGYNRLKKAGFFGGADQADEGKSGKAGDGKAKNGKAKNAKAKSSKNR